MREKAVLFGKFNTLIGVVAEPGFPTQVDRPAVILSNAGLIHRIGPNRIYVKLARSLAANGHIVLRFDLSGVGDSLPRPDHMPIEQFTIDDTLQAMEFLAETYGSQRFILMGHCAGAYHSFRTAAQDQRVTGVVMMNPDGGEVDWVEYDRNRKLARYYENYYSKKTLLDLNRWKRFFSRQVSYRNVIRNIVRNVLWNRISTLIFRIKLRFRRPPPSVADEQLFTMESILRKLLELDKQVLLIYSENATSLERIRTSTGKELKQLNAAGKLDLAVIPGADHVFSTLASQACLLQVIEQWFREHLRTQE